MTYRGRVENGLIVLDSGAKLPEGVEVRVEPVETNQQQTPPQQQDEPKQLSTLAQMLLKHSGTVREFPPDLSANHDHYLYGVPKKT